VGAAVAGPTPEPAVAERFREQLDRLIGALGQEPFCPEVAAEVGAWLVAWGFTDERCLRGTVEILGSVLPERPELAAIPDLPHRVASLLGALAGGYSSALRRHALDHSETRQAQMCASAPVGVALSRLDGAIIEVNSVLARMLGEEPGELAGRLLTEVVHPDDATALAAAYRALGQGSRDRFHLTAKLLTTAGDTVWAEIAGSSLRDAAGQPSELVTFVKDITDLHLLELRVRHQSLHDLLTGLPNRLNFAIQLEAILERRRDAVLLLSKIDLDGFSVVNDGLGIGVGDLLLRSVADRLQELVAKEQAIVARFDADEFAILIEESPSTPNAAALAAQINEVLSEPVYLAGRGLAVSACIGIVRRAAGESDTRELIRAAEATLHRAKHTGRGQWALYDPPADARERARYELAISMPEAWENGAVTLAYQPVVRLDPAARDTGKAVALAAVLRWDHPERGVVAHEECLALAEQSGLVLTIGRWMLTAACTQLGSWRAQLDAPVPPVRVDLTSHLTQDPDLVAAVREALEATGLQPVDLQLGMPVEVIVAGSGDAEDNVRTLADIGVRTVLTRYGQAVGNLALLESLPVHGVEFAGPLVRIPAQRPESVLRPALAALVPLIRRTGRTVLVAGVDSDEQAGWWRHIGADAARGEALGRPVPAQQVPGLLG
jgi:diguanylate cyclase (GGDEF)-like protein/PAS domain S-box-containing protein